MKIPTAALLAAVLLVGRPSFAQDAPPSGIPVPPEQTRPWAPPPTALPPDVVSATAALFEDGMADPRGCEYREVELILGRGTVKAHGWVLPAAADHAPRFAIGWNGLVYPVKTVGPPAAIDGDMTSLIEKRFYDGVRPTDEGNSLTPWAAKPIQVALLLRLGYLPLAEALWANGCKDDKALAITDLFPAMSASWLDPWHQRAIGAYLRDDYPLALAICRDLAPALDRALATARARGRWDPWPERRGGLALWQFPILMAEAQRRTAQPPGESVLDSDRSLAGPERVAALIRDLQLVRVHQWSNPGSTDVAEDPIVQALIAEGDAAVAPLLQCLVEDDRLTRSRYTEHLDFGGPLIPVYEAAYTALFGILKVSFPLFEHDNEDYRWRKEPRHLAPGDRRALAARLEAVWRKSRGADPLEHAYATLRDDAAGADAWFQAVDDLAQPADGTFTTYRLMPPTAGGSYSLHVGGEPFTPRGEALRGRADPSVAALMIRRFELLAGDEAEGASERLPKLGKLLLSLADWDGRGRLDDLRRLEHVLQARFRREGDDVFDQDGVVLRLFEKRLDLGDLTALEDYDHHLQALTPHNLSSNYGSAPECFGIMWRHPDDPAVVRTAEKVFGPNSPWVPFDRPASQNLAYLIRSPLIGVAAFRRELDRGLGDTSPSGELTLAQDGRLNEGNARVYTLDPLAPPRGTKVTYRRCDHYAHELSQADGFPRCELYWPLADRDRAVAACRAFLDRYGDCFRARSKNGQESETGYPTARIHFAPLDHPATEEDVRAGRAIFSLPVPARTCHLPDPMILADRPSRQEDPFEAVEDQEGGKPKQIIDYTTQGAVWQAEETLVDGRWERYYGFVGRYQLEKVPAAEIGFPMGYGLAKVTPGIHGEIEKVSRVPMDLFSMTFSRRDFVPPGTPVPIRVKLVNPTGLDQTVPGAVVLPPGAGKALPPGIALALTYSGKVPPRVQRFSEPEFDFGEWREVPLRGEVRVAEVSASGPTLNPAQTLAVMEFDLREYFDLERAGSYRLRAVFHAPGQKEERSREITFFVAGP